MEFLNAMAARGHLRPCYMSAASEPSGPVVLRERRAAAALSVPHDDAARQPRQQTLSQYPLEATYRPRNVPG
jgi:hypothetical protein